VKQKIINDPIYGFITIPGENIFRIIEHPYVQRLRRIRQLGMTHLVYPGANHTRFHHAIGAMYLMKQAVDVLRSKGHSITEAEEEGALIAILLHDIGHGPFSHTLEKSIVDGIHHEELSELFMDRLNKDFSGQLTTAIKIFRDEYTKKFLHQLVSSQLDMDRLDYLNRDSFFTGVSEGIISSDRIIKMLEVHNDTLAIEAKGIYSIEKFIVARRLMYWQVYLHKTVVSAESMLVNILKRAKELLKEGQELFCTPSLKQFMLQNYSKQDFLSDSSLLDKFAQLDDSDITASIKVWRDHPDKILSLLCSGMMNRRLFKIQIQNKPFDEKTIKKRGENIKAKFNLSSAEINYFILHGKLVNNAYMLDDKINILFKDGSVRDIAEAADTLNIKAMSEAVEKYYLCYPKTQS
jgi:HD superfamily phosphohydrolase